MIFLASEGCFWPLTASMTSEVKNNYAYVITQDICNKFIEVIFLWDVWFHSQIVCCTIEHPWIINEMENVVPSDRTENIYIQLNDWSCSVLF